MYNEIRFMISRKFFHFGEARKRIFVHLRLFKHFILYRSDKAQIRISVWIRFYF